VQYRERAVVPRNLQRQHVTVKRQRAVKVTNLQIDTEEPGQLRCVACRHLLIPGHVTTIPSGGAVAPSGAGGTSG